MRKTIVLIVDGDQKVLNSIKKVLSAEDFQTVFADNAKSALEIMAENKINVLVAGVNLPDMEGVVLLKKVNNKYPDIIKIGLLDREDLANILTSANQGNIFRFIMKPWKADQEIALILKEAVEYYNLRQDNLEIEASLKRNSEAYKNLLRNMEEQLYGCRYDLDIGKKYIIRILDHLAGFGKIKDGQDAQSALGNINYQLRVIKLITEKYLETIPAALEKFSAGDFAKFVDNYRKNELENLVLSANVKELSAAKCFGNYKMLQFILTALFELIKMAGMKQTFRCVTSVTTFDQLIRLNNIIELGYIDGAKVLINKKEILTYDNLDSYCMILNELGKPYNTSVAFTYVNQNTSLITVVSDFSPAIK